VKGELDLSNFDKVFVIIKGIYRCPNRIFIGKFFKKRNEV